MWLGMQDRDENLDVSISTRKAMRAQDRLGWNQFIRGRLTISWGEAINKHLQRHQLKTITAKQWGVSIASINWKYIIVIWLQRNEEQQGATATEKSHQKKRKLIPKIKLIQIKNNKIPHRQWILINALDDVLQDMTEDHFSKHISMERK
jgi:hypothetical protein